MAKRKMPQNIVTPSAETLAAGARRASGRGPAPVHLWDPPYCGEIDMRIARDGTWFYQGTPIGRKPLVRLFASILKREGEEYFLVTPVEKVKLRVDDAPFVAVDVDRREGAEGPDLIFTTNMDEQVVASRDHPIRVIRDGRTDEPAPYLHVRSGLDALIDRKSFYRLVEMGEEAEYDGTRWFGVRSGGRFFPIIPAAELS
jgi:hypothetical protein